MSDRRIAFLIANQNFQDERIQGLSGPLNDIVALHDIMSNPEIGEFDCTIFSNEESYRILPALESALASATPDDTILIYYSGHGIIDRTGGLCLATSNTTLDALRSTSIPGITLKSYAESSYCGSIILILDCCYSGILASGIRGDVGSTLSSLSNARGLYILTSSGEIELSREMPVQGRTVGEFTSVLVGGMLSGEADFNRDGLITLGDALHYTKRRLTAQTPHLYTSGATGDPYLCRVPKPEAKETLQSEIPPRKIHLSICKNIPHPERVVDVAFSRDDRRCVTVCEDGKVRVFELSDFRNILVMQSAPGSLTSARWSRGGNEIATSSNRGEVALWRGQHQIASLSHGRDPITCIEYDPSGQKLASASSIGTVCMWSPQQRKLLWSIRAHDSQISSLNFSRDGRLVLASSYDGDASILEVRSGREVGRLKRKPDELTAAFFTTAGDQCVTASTSGEVCIWSTREGSVTVATKHSFWVKALAYLERSNLIVSGGFDALIKVIDLDTHHVHEGARVHEGPVIAIDASHDESLLTVTTYDGSVYFLDLKISD